MPFHFFTILRILGILLLLFSLTMLPPIGVSLLYKDNNALPFILSFITTLAVGLVMWLPTHSRSKELRYREGFLVVVLFWTVLASFGAIPLLLSQKITLTLTEAFFESMSGLTTTGATIIINLDSLPQSLLYYRQQLQWLGGMGIIVLAVAIMPMLGIGGMQMYRAEAPGPIKDSKLTPRITQTAKALWFTYVVLTTICALSYWLAGMSFFDALCHSFSTIAIGGFSTHDSSIGHFNSAAVETVAVVFMLIASANFSLHFWGFRYGKISVYWSDAEYRFFLKIMCIFGLIICITLITYQSYHNIPTAIRQGIFHLVSIATTTGFTVSGYAWWPSILPLLLIGLSFMGGCAGSTAGGIKVMRIQLLLSQARREITALVHPNAVLSIKNNDNVIGITVLTSINVFLSLYIFCFVLSAILLCLTGLDWITAFSAAAACLNNLGPGLGEVADNYASASDSALWIMAFTMLLGRLELFTLLVLFTRTYWRN